MINELSIEKADAVIMAVAHNEFKTLEVESFVNDKHVIFDVKGFMNKKIIDGRL